MAMELQGDSGSSFYIYHTAAPTEVSKACGNKQSSCNSPRTNVVASARCTRLCVECSLCQHAADAQRRSPPCSDSGPPCLPQCQQTALQGSQLVILTAQGAPRVAGEKCELNVGGGSVSLEIRAMQVSYIGECSSLVLISLLHIAGKGCFLPSIVRITRTCRSLTWSLAERCLKAVGVVSLWPFVAHGSTMVKMDCRQV